MKELERSTRIKMDAGPNKSRYGKWTSGSRYKGCIHGVHRRVAYKGYVPSYEIGFGDDLIVVPFNVGPLQHDERVLILLEIPGGLWD